MRDSAMVRFSLHSFQRQIERLEAQAAPFDPVYHLGQQVVGLEGDAESGFTATTSAGTVIEAKAVSIAAGAGAFGPNRPPLDGLEAYEGNSVFYLVKRKEDFRDKAVVIAGGDVLVRTDQSLWCFSGPTQSN